MKKAALLHLQTDPVMAAIIKRVGPPKMKPRRLSPFESLTQAIVYQQLSGKAAETIFNRFLALYPEGKFPHPLHVTKTSFEQLRSAGLSRAKATYIQGLAQHAVDELLPTLEKCDALTDAELIEVLTSIKGVGRWTAEMLLMFNLGRPDILPIHDLGVRRGYQVAYRKRQMPTPKQLEKFGQKWSPYRSTAAWYLWQAADFPKNEKW